MYPRHSNKQRLIRKTLLECQGKCIDVMYARSLIIILDRGLEEWKGMSWDNFVNGHKHLIALWNTWWLSTSRHDEAIISKGKEVCLEMMGE